MKIILSTAQDNANPGTENIRGLINLEAVKLMIFQVTRLLL
jgi:hypothetical protein